MPETADPDQAGGPQSAGRFVFDRPYETEGVTVIPAWTTRGHRARRRPDAAGRRSHLDAELLGGRPAGALIVRDGVVRWRPAIDVNRLLVTAECVVGAVLVASKLARRPSGARAAVTMGPGGWVSLKGGSMAVRPAARLWRRVRPDAPEPARPLWAKVLSAKSLQSLLRY